MFPIRVCGWHWSGGGGQILLPGFILSHGICPLCRQIILLEIESAKGVDIMRVKSPEWVKLYLEGKWTKLPSAGWNPIFQRMRDNMIQQVTPTYLSYPDEPFVFTIDGVEKFRGDLTECFYAAGGYDT